MQSTRADGRCGVKRKCLFIAALVASGWIAIVQSAESADQPEKGGQKDAAAKKAPLISQPDSEALRNAGCFVVHNGKDQSIVCPIAAPRKQTANGAHGKDDR